MSPLRTELKLMVEQEPKATLTLYRIVLYSIV